MMNDKPNVVCSSIWFPLSISRYFESALERRSDINLFTTGVFTGNWIPWSGGMELSPKYYKSPTVPLDRSLLSTKNISPALVQQSLPEEIDLWIQIDGGSYFYPRPNAKTVVHVATDPHVGVHDPHYTYDRQRTISDKFFNMQKCYMKEGDIYLPYAADPRWHYPERQEKIYDCSLIGLHYPNRVSLVSQLRSQGKNVYFDIGQVFDEYRQINCQSRMVINWSSQDDLIARVFEAMAMGLPLVTNRVPDLPLHFGEDIHYLGFDTQAEAIEKVNWVLDNPQQAYLMAQSAMYQVKNNHTYDHRIQQIFDEVGL